jgi:hypothetical protein
VVVRHVLVTAIIAFAATVAGFSPAVARDTPLGTVYLTTLPSGADTWVDGAYVGHSPVLIDALTTGKHTITAAKTGWVSRELQVTVSEQVPFQFVDFQLERDATAPPASGTLSLHAGSPIKTLTVDGVATKLSSGKKVALTPGDHEIVVETQRGEFKREVVIYPDMTTNVVLRGGSETADRAIVVAPASNYLSATDLVLDGKHIEIRHNGHHVTGTLGDATMRIDGSLTTFDTPPAVIAGKLFLPMALYVRIGAVPLRTR